MWVLVAVGLEAWAGDRSVQTRLCQDVQLVLEEGGKKRDVVRILKETYLTVEDVSCLQGAELPAYAARKAQALLVKDGGLQALPTGPVEVWALVPDPCAIMGTQAPIIGLFGQAVCMIDLTGLISDQVVEYIEEQGRAALAAEGLEGEVQLDALELPAMEGISWEGSTPRTNAVAAGRHHVLHVHLPDAVAAARAVRGDLLVGIGARRGVDVMAEVRESVRQQVWSQLAAHHVPSVLVDLEGQQGR
jgi:hypothetical protein